MRAKCPKCGAVFELPLQPSLIHIGPWRYTKCPACGKGGLMNNFVSDPVTWPPEEHPKDKAPESEDDVKKKRIDDSKYERPDDERSK
jgi:hypothetical protein